MHHHEHHGEHHDHHDEHHKHFCIFGAIYRLIATILPTLGQLVQIPFVCLGESDYLFCNRLNFHRLEHRHEHVIDMADQKLNEIVDHLKPAHIWGSIVHSISRKYHHITEKVDSWVSTFGGDLDLEGASWSSFGLITAGQFLVTILMAGLFVLDMKLGYSNFNNIVGLLE